MFGLPARGTFPALPPAGTLGVLDRVLSARFVWIDWPFWVNWRFWVDWRFWIHWLGWVHWLGCVQWILWIRLSEWNLADVPRHLRSVSHQHSPGQRWRAAPQ